MSGYCEGCGNTLCVCPMTAHDDATSPIRDARFAATDAMLEHLMSPAGAVCSCGYEYRRDPIGGHVPFAQIASHYAEVALATAAPILLAAERQRIAAAIRANHQRAYHLDSTAGPLCICGRLDPCPDAALAARIAEAGP